MGVLRRMVILGIAAALSLAPASVRTEGAVSVEPDLVAAARAAMEKAARYFTGEVATRGGYLWFYSQDLKQREGEGAATATQIWVQPPGTPAVGFAYLRAYEVTRDRLYLDAARGAAEALVWGQLACGGWDYLIDFDAAASKRWYYRRDKDTGQSQQDRLNRATFDDDTTQSAVRFLIAAAKATGDANLEAGARYGLRFVLESQFPNGAWPQWYPLANHGYSRWYTFNDHAINDCIQVMLDAYHAYGDAVYLERAKLGGDFIILSQLPAPQATWAQQYDYDPKPAPARWFEPAAACSAESVGNLHTLMDLYLETGDEKYLRPIPAAITWFKNSRLPDGNWARFYELGTNRPIYVNAAHRVVYDTVDLRPGYSWQGQYGVEAAVKRYEHLHALGRDASLAEQRRAPSANETAQRLHSRAAQAKAVVAGQDERGRWVREGRIYCEDFIRNLGILTGYIALACAAQPAPK